MSTMFREYREKLLQQLSLDLKRKYGYQMAPTRHMFLSACDVMAEDRCRVRWLYGKEII